MAWIFHVVELTDGRWACRHGRKEYDQHDSLDVALRHIALLAKDEDGAAEVVIHSLDGSIRRAPIRSERS